MARSRQPYELVRRPTGITASTPLGGSETAVNKMPPTVIVNYILRVL